MLHSAASSNSNFNMFQLFIYQILQGEKSYKNSVDSILEETQKLIKGEKNIYNINRSNFSLIYHLSEKFEDFLLELDLKNIKEEDYSFLLNKMKEDSELTAV